MGFWAHKRWSPDPLSLNRRELFPNPGPRTVAALLHAARDGAGGLEQCGVVHPKNSHVENRNTAQVPQPEAVPSWVVIRPPTHTRPAALPVDSAGPIAGAR